MFFRKSSIIEKAKKLASKGQFDQAIQLWEKIGTESPDDGNIFNAIGDLYLKADQKKKATDLFVKAGEAFQTAGFELKSIAVFKKALKVDPSRVEINEKLASVNAERGLIGNAIGDYLKAAKYYLQQDNFHASLTVYRKISDLDPENTDILVQIAEMCQKQDYQEEAIEEYKKVVAIFEEKGRTEDAGDIVEIILGLDPSFTRKKEFPPQESSTEIPTPNAENVSPEEDLSPVVDSELPAYEAITPDNENTNFLEPEPELMTDEQTIYSSEDSFQVDPEEGAKSGSSMIKSLENYLTEVEVYCQYDLIDKALDQLNAASEQYPSSIELHIKLKEVYSKQGTTEKVVEECSILASLYKEIGDETKRQAILDEMMTITSKEKESDPSYDEKSNIRDLSEHPKVLEADSQSDQSKSGASSIDLVAPSVDEQNFSLSETSILEDKTSSDVKEEELPLIHGERDFDFANEGKSSLTNESSEADLNTGLLEEEKFPKEFSNKEEEVHLLEEDFSLLKSSQEIEQLVKGDENLHEKIEDDSISIDFEEPTLASIDFETNNDSHPLQRAEASSVDFENEPIAEADSPEPSLPEPSLDEMETNEEYVDLQSILSEDLGQLDDETTLEKTIRHFQDKTQMNSDTQEIETQYELGIAYKEMGMLPEAIIAFKLAFQGESRFLDAIKMLVTCHFENGSSDVAVDILQKAMVERSCSKEVMIALKYELALLYDQQGNKERALFLFDEIFKVDPSFREVSSKRSILVENDFESTWDAPLDEDVSIDEIKEKKKDRVSYL